MTTPRTTRPTLYLLGRLLTKYHQPFQSDFQNDHFVLAQEGITLWGAFKQGLREIATRIEALRTEYLTLNESRVEVSSRNAAASKVGEITGREDAKRRSEKAQLHFKAARATLRKVSVEMTLIDREREFANLLNRTIAIFSALEEEHGDLTQEKIAVLEREFWSLRMLRRALAEKACTGTISPGTLESIMALPHEEMTEIMGEIRQSPQACLQALGTLLPVNVAALEDKHGRMIRASQVKSLVAGEFDAPEDEEAEEMTIAQGD